MDENVKQKLEESRKELLELGFGNPLLNHSDRAKQIKVKESSSSVIFDMLVLKVKPMSFRAIIDEKDPNQPIQIEDISLFDAVDKEDLMGKESEEEEGNISRSGTNISRKLQTDLTAEKLQTRLISMHRDARSYIEEQGVNGLFLALGYLEWYDINSDLKRRSPLILIPVELKRTNSRERFQLNYTGDDIVNNLSLIEKIESPFNIQLPRIPEIDDTVSITSYYNSVQESIKSQPSWKVKGDDIALGFFSFGKFLMYQDLDPNKWTEEKREGGGFSIIKSLLTNGFIGPRSQFNDLTDIDSVLPPLKVMQVKDADSTQILAILDVNSGRNMVIQGPPGTGKSQTITNIIAECIGAGKKVLFVSEKMVALEVVKRRLEGVGLGDTVLELHSNKTNKRKVLDELNRTIQKPRPTANPQIDDITQLTQLQNELNDYCSAVNRPIGKTSICFIKALGLALKNKPKRDDIPAFDFNKMREWSENNYRQAKMQVENLDDHLSKNGSPANNPFVVSGLSDMLPSQLPNFKKTFSTGLDHTNALLSEIADLASTMGFTPPVYRADIDILYRAALRTMEAPNTEGIAISSKEWDTRHNDIKELIAIGRALSIAHAKYDALLLEEAWTKDVTELQEHYLTKGKKWWRFISSDYRQSKLKLQSYCCKPLSKDVSETIKLLETIIDSQKQQKLFDNQSKLGATLFGAQWKQSNSDWEVLEKLTEWVVALHQDMKRGNVPDGIVNILSHPLDPTELQKKLNRVDLCLNNHKTSMDSREKALQLTLKDEEKTDWSLTLKGQADTLASWIENIDKLGHYIQFKKLAATMTQEGLDFVVTAAKTRNFGSGTLIETFIYSWYNGLVEMAVKESPSLNSFDANQHNLKQTLFKELDHRLFLHNQARLAHLHWDSVKALDESQDMRIEMQTIQGQFARRRNMSIRQLMDKAGKAIQTIKPVFMMGPMSVATYIPPGSVKFDLVIFDEASQVKPVDAFGAILRGKQAVVVGDSKQLPPTSFFEAQNGNDDIDSEDYEDIVGDTESILSLFLGKGADFKMLRWHYRSRHDSLIAVSNHEFYDNRLVIFPSPGRNAKARGLKFHHLPDTAYEIGTTKTNPKEAKAVANAVFTHAKSFPELTLGVVTFSGAQRDAILNQLYILQAADKNYVEFFKENKQEEFFVKSIEEVQGDERDVIMISIGYGKTAEGKLSLKFGPLSNKGGERRLNVLISRAKLAMDVFSNFTSNDIDLRKTEARGTVALRSFLAYAQTLKLTETVIPGNEPDSPFEEEVIKALTQHGVNVVPQVGTAGFFIDIGVTAKDKPGKYILGIECDGATYHSSRSARDRDRLRQEVLENLGWRLHRIWSTDWFRNPGAELNRALEAIKVAEKHFDNEQECAEPLELVAEETLDIHQSEIATHREEPPDISVKKSDLKTSEEIKQSILSLLAKGQSLSREEVVENAARKLGIPHLQPEATALFYEQINSLIRSKMLTFSISNGKYTGV